MQTNPAREARRGKFLILLNKNAKGIQINPAREARRGNAGAFYQKTLRKYKQIRSAKRAGEFFGAF